jgi:hypothetical protein
VALVAAPAWAQGQKLTPGDVYCSGIMTHEAVSADTYMISGEQSNMQTVYAQGDHVYINRGSSSGVKVGDEFQILRQMKNPRHVKWFRDEGTLLRAMGRQWADIGRVRVVHTEAGVAIARVTLACDYLQRGDIARPFAERPIPEIVRFDGNFWPAPSGKQQGMVVSAKHWELMVAQDDIAYVNIGSAQGVKAGDYVRFFRYQGTRHDTAYQPRKTQYEFWGFGKTPVPYQWNQLPRELLGEGVVLRVSANTATVFVMTSLKPIYMGDYLEIK